MWPLYKARCAELRSLKKLEKKLEVDLQAMKVENESLRIRAERAEREAEVAVRRRTELQELLDAEKARHEWGDPNTFGSSTSVEGSGVAFARNHAGR